MLERAGTVLKLSFNPHPQACLQFRAGEQRPRHKSVATSSQTSAGGRQPSRRCEDAQGTKGEVKPSGRDATSRSTFLTYSPRFSV